MIFQDPMTSLNPVYRIGEQLEEVYIQHGKGNRKEAKERAAYLLDKVGIIAPQERLSQFPHQLSGGLRQRMMIAMTLMCEPSLVIADEPTTALDVTMQAQTLNLLSYLQDEFNMGLILIRIARSFNFCYFTPKPGWVILISSGPNCFLRHNALIGLDFSW